MYTCLQAQVTADVTSANRSSAGGSFSVRLEGPANLLGRVHTPPPPLLPVSAQHSKHCSVVLQLQVNLSENVDGAFRFTSCLLLGVNLLAASLGRRLSCLGYWLDAHYLPYLMHAFAGHICHFQPQVTSRMLSNARHGQHESWLSYVDFSKCVQSSVFAVHSKMCHMS